MEYLRTLRKLFFAAAATARKELFGVGVEREGFAHEVVVIRAHEGASAFSYVGQKAGLVVRRAFVPDQGCLFCSADYSQIELRIMAHLSGDRHMIEAFREGSDIHAATAAKIYKVPIGEVTADMRRKAKTANFGIIYGISVFGLAERLNIPRSEAKALIDGSELAAISSAASASLR